MSTDTNEHGWGPKQMTGEHTWIRTGPAVDPLLRCGCQKSCLRSATEEDLLCDECRDTCTDTERPTE